MLRIIKSILGIVQNNFERVSTIPETAQRNVIGNSVKNQPIVCYKLGTGSKKVLFASAIHGNEVGTVKLAYKLLNSLSQNQAYLTKYTFCIIPVLNPDGYALALSQPDYINGGKMGRFNAHNVDLNRNFATRSFTSQAAWNQGKDYSIKQQVFAGDKGNSEPETLALTDFILKEKIELLFMFHNVGKDVAGSIASSYSAKLFSDKTGFKLISEEEWKKFEQTGTAKEWCDEHAIKYLEIEAPTRWGSAWNLIKPGIESVLAEN